MGRPPFEGETAHEVYMRILSEDPPRPRRIRTDCPYELEAVALKALEKSPQQRYPTAAEFAADLDRWLAGEPVRATRPSLRRTVVRRLLRRRYQVAATAATVVAVVALGLWAAAQMGERAARQRAAAARPHLEKGKELLERAMEAERREDWEWADVEGWLRKGEESLRTAVALDPDSFESRLHLGRLLYFRRAGRTDLGEAARCFGRAIELQPQSALARRYRGLVRLEMGDEAGAREDLARAHELGDPGSDETLVTNMVRLVAQEKYEEAYDLVRKFLPDPSRRTAEVYRIFPDLLKIRAEALLGRYRESQNPQHLTMALESLDGALRIVPGREDLHRIRANVLSALGRHEEAIESACKCVRYRDNAASRYLLGKMLVWGGRYQEAVAEYTQAIERARAADGRAPPGYMTDRGWARQHAGDREGALADYEEALRLDPNDHNAWVNRGGLRLEAGDAEGALADYTRAIELFPHPMRFVWRAGVLLELGRKEEAERDLAEAQRRGWEAPEVLRAVAARWMREPWEDYARAEELLSRALEIQPQNAELWAERALVRLVQGNYRRAIEDCTRALERGPGRADWFFWRGWAREQEDDWVGAADDYRAALRNAPPDWTNREQVEKRLRVAEEQLYLRGFEY